MTDPLNPNASDPRLPLNAARLEAALEARLPQLLDMAQAVLSQLDQDAEQSLPCQYDVEFLSAYFDRALYIDHADDTLLTQRIQTFERHLPQCDPCNLTLGRLLELTDLYRNAMYTFESRLEGFDVTPMVMARYMREQALLDESLAIPAVGCGAITAETFSALVDDELATDELRNVIGHNTACPPCDTAQRRLGAVSQHVQQYYQDQLHGSLNTPELWPSIAAQLDTTEAEPISVVPLRRRSRLPWIGTAVAAAVMVVLLSGRLMPVLAPSSSQTAKAPQPVNVAALEEALRADEAENSVRDSAAPAAYTESVVYTSPEAYLFSSEADLLSDDELGEDFDVSAIVLEETLSGPDADVRQ